MKRTSVTFGVVKKIFGIIAAAFAVVAIAIIAINFTINTNAQSAIFSELPKIPQMQTGLVLGAQVRSDGSMSDMLRDRCDTAFDLYAQGRIQKLLVSGDHGQPNYDEVNTMKRYLLDKGVNPQDLFLDHAGFDTYDSIYRAQAIFQVESLTIITQEFHLPRSLYISQSLGIPAVGMIADRYEYANIAQNAGRESLAKVKAVLDVLLRSQPKYLGDHIPITGDSRASWD